LELLQTERRIEDAISAASRLLSLDPLQENVHRNLMRLYVEQGRYDAALNQFEQCRKRLSETLGVQPEQETRDLAADVRSKRRQPAAEVQSPPTRSKMGQIEALSGQDDVLTYPERPSIAVLPFTNMSGDPEQEYFADGITEDIITELGRFREIFVIARNSSFAFKGKFVDAPQVGKLLGARYLLEGSVRRAGSRIRISAEMIEASSRAQIWADRYDRDLSDVFALQDEISRTIVVTMAGRLTEEHANHVSRKPTENLSAYDCVLRGQGYVHKYTSEAFDQARIYFEQAVSLDPGFARAFSWLAYIEAQGCLYWQMSTEGLDGAIQTGERAIALDQNDATGHMALGLARLFNREHDKAGYHLERAAAINPNDQLTMIETARYKMYTGDPHGGAHIIHVAMSQNPYHPNWYYNVLARCLHTAQDYAGAIAALERLDVLNFWCHAYLAGCYAEMGQTQKSADHAMQVLKLKPDFTLNKFARIFPYRDIDVSDAFFSGMRKAGLPE
jgi:adenylate cyclase